MTAYTKYQNQVISKSRGQQLSVLLAGKTGARWQTHSTIRIVVNSVDRSVVIRLARPLSDFSSIFVKTFSPNELFIRVCSVLCKNVLLFIEFC